MKQEGKNKPKLLIRCPKCHAENYALAVIKGICVWCGYNGKNDPNFKGQ